MSNQGLSENKLEELRKQREEARKLKAEKEQQEKIAEEQRKLQEQQEQEKLHKEKEAEIEQLKADKQRLEEEKKQRDEKEREEKEKQIAELKAEKEELKAEKKRLEEERRAEKLRIEEEKKAEKKRLEEEKKAEKKRLEEEKKAEKLRMEEEKKAEKLKAQEKAKKQKEPKEIKEPKKAKSSKKKEKVVEETPVQEEQQEVVAQENNQVEEKQPQKDKEKIYSTNVQVVSDEDVLIDKEVFEETDEEDGKVQVGFTMVDKSLVSQAKGNQRYGIKERSEAFKKLNSIVFYIAIPLMLIWTIIAFGGICTARVGHTSFADNVYYKVPDNVTILSEETNIKFKTGDVLSAKNVELSKLEKGNILCIEYTLPGTNEHKLYLVRVTSSESIDSAGNYNVLVNTDIEDEYLSAVISTSEKGNSLGNDGIRYLGVVTGKSIIIGQFLMFCQNIVVFIFLVAIPAAVILTFQFINLYDGLRIFIKQRQIGKAKNKQKKKVDNRDKIKR